LRFECKLLKEGSNEETEDRGEITLLNDNGKPRFRSSFNLTEEQILQALFKGMPPERIKEFIQPPPGGLIMEAPFIPFFWPAYMILASLPIYDFDPKLAKRAVSISGSARLEENGHNLTLVLKNLLKNEAKKEELSTRLKGILPFIADLNVEPLADKSFLFTLKEQYHDSYLPASVISDGTIDVTALVIALFFESMRPPPFPIPATFRLTKIIEEPGKSVHPYLLSQIAKMIEGAANKQQIIFTTHNPEIIKHIEPENLLLISRDSDGFSVATRPMDKELIRAFLDNDVLISELFVQDLLED